MKCFLVARPVRVSLEFRIAEKWTTYVLPPECQLLPRNTLVIGSSPQTHSLPLQNGWPMAQRYKLEIFSKLMTFFLGLCTGLDGSIVLFGDFLCECGNARQHFSDVSSPPLWLPLHLVGGSI